MDVFPFQGHAQFVPAGHSAPKIRRRHRHRRYQLSTFTGKATLESVSRLWKTGPELAANWFEATNFFLFASGHSALQSVNLKSFWNISFLAVSVCAYIFRKFPMAIHTATAWPFTCTSKWVNLWKQGYYPERYPPVDLLFARKYEPKVDACMKKNPCQMPTSSPWWQLGAIY